MKIKLSAEPNPDFPKTFHRGSVQIAERWQVVSDFKEASATARKFITDNELGSGNWTGGQIVDDAGSTIAHVSYNGRVWSGAEWPSEEIVIA